MKKFGPMLLMLLLLLSGCTGGQEIESGLFVIAMAVDAAPEGNLTVTVKALRPGQPVLHAALAALREAQEQARAERLNLWRYGDIDDDDDDEDNGKRSGAGAAGARRRR